MKPAGSLQLWRRVGVPAIALLALGACSLEPHRRTGVDETPAPQAVTVEELIREIRKPGNGPVLVNVWATWCPPCREEFPDLLRLKRAYEERGLRLLLVSADFDDRGAQRFLADHGVDFVTYLKTGDDMVFINALDARWSGALPATFVHDAQGAPRFFRQGRMTYEELEHQVLAALGTLDSLSQEDAP